MEREGGRVREEAETKREDKGQFKSTMHTYLHSQPLQLASARQLQLHKRTLVFHEGSRVVRSGPSFFCRHEATSASYTYRHS